MDLMKKSVNVLKSMQLSNGGILATPVDGAYPYVYIRDAVIISKAFNRVGLTKNSEKFYSFVKRVSKLENYGEIFHRYNKQGLPSVSRKHQHDNIGLVLHGIYDTYLYSEHKKFLKEMWPLVDKCCQLLLNLSKSGLVYTETSIHELYRLEKGFEIWANCACCRGLYDAAKIADVLGYEKEKKAWKKCAEKIERNIKKKMFNKKTGLFVKNLRHKEVNDISQLAPFYFGIEDSKRLLKISLRHISKNLLYAEGGGFRRFKRFGICKDWHWYTGGSGGWLAFTFWMADFYRRVGNKKNYKICLDWVNLVALRTGGLLPEHVSTKAEYDAWKIHEVEFNNRLLSGMRKSEDFNKRLKKKFNEDFVYWAIPLGWAHAEYIILMKGNKDGL